MPYAHLRFLFRRDGVPSQEQGSGGAPAGSDPGTIGWARPTGSVIECVDTGDTFKFDGTNWDQDLNVNSTFEDAADTHDMKTETVTAPDADSAVAVAAREEDNVALGAWAGPFTNPDVPRNLTITFEAAWAGGDVTVVGTDMAGGALTETIADTAGAMVTGTKVFATVTSATNESVGAGGVNHGATIGFGHKLGLLNAPAIKGGILMVDGVSEDATWDNTAASYGFIPTTMPNAAHNYVAEFPKAGATTVVTATA